eukprot:482599-Pyramimonas_sp.AAC.1
MGLGSGRPLKHLRPESWWQSFYFFSSSSSCSSSSSDSDSSSPLPHSFLQPPPCQHPPCFALFGSPPLCS